jgi:hypothetical protein
MFPTAMSRVSPKIRYLNTGGEEGRERGRRRGERGRGKDKK